MSNTKTEERRKQAMLGELPPGFLQLNNGPSSSTNTADQLALDAQAAMALQQRYNTNARPVQGPPGPGQPYMVYSNAFVPPNTRGKLTLTVAQAKLTKNYGLVRMDPYCRLRVGTSIFETPTDPNGAKTPNWNRTVQCYLPNGVDSIYVEIFDERAFTIDERIAWGHIMVPDAAINGETVDDWYALSGQQGEGKEGMLNIVIAFSPLNAQSAGYVPVSNPQMGGGAATAQQPQQQQLPPVPHNVGPMFTEEDVKELGEMFPNLDGEVIKSVLEEKRGNKEATINGLLSMTE